MGGMGGMGGAMNALGFGLNILSMIIEQQNQPGDQAPGGPSSLSAIATTTSTANAPVTENEKAAILSQIRPVRTGSYAATAPSPASTSDIQAQKQALLNQIRPTTRPSTGGTGTNAGAAQKPPPPNRPPSSAEAASANRREPFDNARQGSTRTAADQLCQAAGQANGCIGKFNPSGRPAATPVASHGPSVVVLPPNATIPQVPGQACALSVDQPRKVGMYSLGPRRAAGYPIANDLDQLRSFDYSDIKANLASSSPEKLAVWGLQARQQIARTEALLDALKSKLFEWQLGASVPVKSPLDAARDALYESARNIVPLWRQMEALGQGKAEADLKTAGEYFDQVDKAVIERDIANGNLARALRGVGERPGMSELTRSYATSLVEGTLAVDHAYKRETGQASEHAGKAAAALVPMAQWLVPEEALPTLAKADAWTKVALIGVEVVVQGTEAAKARSEALEARATSEETARALARQVDALNARLRELRTVQALITQDARCN